MRISGILRLPPGDRSCDISRVRITVRDITEFDAPARTVAQLDLPDVHLPAAGLELPFELDADVDERRSYSLRAHADVQGSGSVAAGDLVSMTNHTVWPAQADPLVVSLQPVAG
jgi:uncharacterized lipoprotein YbaY